MNDEQRRVALFQAQPPILMLKRGLGLFFRPAALSFAHVEQLHIAHSALLDKKIAPAGPIGIVLTDPGSCIMSELYSEHPVMFKNNPIGFIVSIILIPVFGIGLVILLVWHLQNKASKLTINDSEILYEKGLLSKERSEVNISSVRTTKVKQSFFDRIFGVGAIEIYTAGDSPEIVAKGLPDPNRISEIIRPRKDDQ
ncbi:MAG: PH domain-containing protein [Candidatus Thiodiazotropha taylori]